MSGETPSPLVVGGWTIFAHPLFLDQLDALIQQVETLKRKDPVGRCLPGLPQDAGERTPAGRLGSTACRGAEGSRQTGAGRSHGE